MCRNVLLAVVLFSFVVGCGQPGGVDSCRFDADCEGILICMMDICVVPDRDGGAMSSRDSGTSQDAGANVEVDAGEVDAGGADAGGTCVPSIELCNGIDDDCDGFIDDMAMVSALDAGVIELDGGQALSNGMCTMGLGACASTGMTSCVAGALTCNAIPSMPGVERCNGIDDDCDGQTDENDPGICSVTGQVCNGGACACPSGQSVCNGQCKVLSAEICDGLDNDCNGQIDEGVTITCLSDGDNDGYATDATTSQQCADASRAAFGNCPAGYVAPSASPATDCQPTDGTRYRLVSSRADADADTYCSGSVSDDCVGTAALPGRRFASACASTNDCDDAQAARYQLLSARADVDGDGYCAGVSAPVCSGAQPPAGYRLPTACLGGDATIDCNDAAGSVFRLANVAADADNDGYCTTTGSQTCIGINPPAGSRLANTCNVDNLDCNDTNPNLVRTMSLRTDADGDRWCSSNTFTQCVGPGAAPAGTQYAANCQGNDCRDSNPYATGSCTFLNAFVTAYHTHLGIDPGGNFTVNTVTACPTGFSVTGWRADRAVGSLNGFCSATSSPNVISQSANGFDGSTCRIVGDCVAN